MNTSTKDNDSTKTKHNNNNSNKGKRAFTSVKSNQPCSSVNSYQNNANTAYNASLYNYELNESDDSNNNNNNTYSQHIQKQIQYTLSNTHSSPVNVPNSSITTSSTKSSSLLYLRKMFVGGLPPQLTTETLISYFSKFGPVEKGIIMTDKHTGRTRGFGFLIFVHKETVDKIMSISNCYCLCGKWIECKRAYPKEQQVKMINESATSATVNMNNNNDNDNLVLNDVLSDKSQSLSGNKSSNESNLFMYQNYIPKSQIKFFIKSNININKSNESSIDDQQNQFININNTIQQHSQQQFQFYFNNCITNPSNHNYFRYKLFDTNGKDVSKLMLYKNSCKTTLFTEEQDKTNTISNNSNCNTTYSTGATTDTNITQSNCSSTTLFHIHKQQMDYLYYDNNKHTSNQTNNQSWIGNYFMNNTNTTNMSTNNSNSNNLIVNYYTNVNSKCTTDNTNLLELIIPTDINNMKTHQPLNDIDNTNTTMNISSNEVDVSSDFVDESFNDDDCYGPNIQKRKMYRKSSSNDSYRPY